MASKKTKAAKLSAETLDFFKYNPETDGEQTFNIDKALNENWDKVKSEFEKVETELERVETEIGKVDVSTPINNHNVSGTAHQDIRNSIAALERGKVKYVDFGVNATNPNDITDTGEYRCNAWNTAQLPSGQTDGQGMLKVITYNGDQGGSAWLKQWFISPHTGKVYERAKIHTTWQGWTNVNESPTISGKITATSNCHRFGTFSGDGNQFAANNQLAKDNANIVFHDNGGNNWSGIICDSGGQLQVKSGTGGRPGMILSGEVVKNVTGQVAHGFTVTNQDISGQDLNNVTYPNVYKGSSLKNAPPSTHGWHYVEVFAHAGTWVMQRATCLHDPSLVYSRRLGDDGWSQWTSISRSATAIRPSTAALYDTGLVNINIIKGTNDYQCKKMGQYTFKRRGLYRVEFTRQHVAGQTGMTYISELFQIVFDRHYYLTGGETTGTTGAYIAASDPYSYTTGAIYTSYPNFAGMSIVKADGSAGTYDTQVRFLGIPEDGMTATFWCGSKWNGSPTAGTQHSKNFRIRILGTEVTI